MKNDYLTVALVVSWQNTALVNIGSQVKVLFVAENVSLLMLIKSGWLNLRSKSGYRNDPNRTKKCLF